MLVLLLGSKAQAQSLEVMPGTERVFVDLQWLGMLSENKRWSVFSRTRATADYDAATNLFTGAYFNYTTQRGIGLSGLANISTSGPAGGGGVHYFKANKQLLVFALAFAERAPNSWHYSWFSIVRYRPQLNDNWRVYTGLELFTRFTDAGHVVSVQGLRAGLEYKGVQFGLATNVYGFGADYDRVEANPGVFIRKEF